MPKKARTFKSRCKQADRAYNAWRRSDPRRAQIERWRSSVRWARLRQMKLNQNPVCEMCEAEGRATAAEQVHHKQGALERPDLFFVLANLVSICKPHHAQIEADVRKNKTHERPR